MKYDVENFRINQELILEHSKLVNRLFLRLKGAVCSLVIPESVSAQLRLARSKCKSADKLLAQAHTLTNYRLVVDNLKIAYSIIESIDNELANVCYVDLNNATAFLNQRIYETAIELRNVAEVEFNRKNYDKAKSCFEVASNYFKEIHYEEQVEDINKKILLCDKEMDLKTVEIYVKQAKEYHRCDEYNTAISFLTNSIQLLSLPKYENCFSKKVEELQTLKQKYMLDKQNMIDRCNNEGDLLKTQAVALLKENKCCEAKNLLIQAKEKFKKAENSKNVKDCSKSIEDCNKLIQQNNEIEKACKLMQEKKFYQAKQIFEASIELFKQYQIEKVVGECNSNVKRCVLGITRCKKTGNILWESGIRYLKENNVKEAEEFFNKAKIEFTNAGEFEFVRACDNGLAACKKVVQANEILKQAEDSKNKGHLSDAMRFFEDAKKIYKSAGLTKDSLECDKEISDCKRMIENYKIQANKFKNTANDYYYDKNFYKALTNFKSAKEMFIKAYCFPASREMEEEIERCERILQAQKYYNDGISSSNNGYYNDAISKFRSAIEIFDCYKITKEDVSNCYKNIRHCKENIASSYYNKGVNYYDDDRYEEAIEQFKEAMECYKELGMLDKVEKCYKVIEDSKYNWAVDLYNEACEKYNDGIQCERLTYLDEAQKLFQKAKDLGYNSWECMQCIRDCENAENDLRN